MVGIVSWGTYLPRYRIKTEEIAKVWGKDPLQMKNSLMIEEKTVPAVDEDTVTIAVEAARNALSASPIAASEIGAIYIGSESHPYAVKPTGTIVGEAIGVPTSYTTADFEFACKAGTAAMQAAMGLVKSGMVKNALVGGADTAQAAPGDALEYSAAAGGALFIIGSENVAAEIEEIVSFTTDTPDFWRRQHEQYPAHGGPFTGEPAYFRHVMGATEALLKKIDAKPSDFDHVVFHQPNGKFPRRVAKRLGFTDKQLRHGLLVGTVGNTYSGSSLLGLAAVLDIAKPGERILLTSYGSGAGSDSFSIKVTDKITKLRKNMKPLSEFHEGKKYVSYPEYMKQTGKLK